MKAHRFSYELSYGSVLNDMFVCHKCDNRMCVRPEHLFLGTAKDNTADMMQKGRLRFDVGEDCSFAKLTEDQVREIIVLYATCKYGYGELGKLFRVTRHAIRDIIRKKNWKHIV